jgi:circadian clock protein KaiC
MDFRTSDPPRLATGIPGLVVGAMTSPVDVSYLSDTVVLLRYFEANGRMRKAVSVVKKRSGWHEDTIRELSFDRSGIRVGPPLSTMRGILTGVPSLEAPPEKDRPRALEKDRPRALR